MDVHREVSVPTSGFNRPVVVAAAPATRVVNCAAFSENGRSSELGKMFFFSKNKQPRQCNNIPYCVDSGDGTVD